jgi:hypothetical protein
MLCLFAGDGLAVCGLGCWWEHRREITLSEESRYTPMATAEEIETLTKDFVRAEGYEFVKFIHHPTPRPGHAEGVSIEWHMSVAVRKTSTGKPFILALNTSYWEGGGFTISPDYTLIPL